MTDEYDHQWPQAMCSPDAVSLHWGHSILDEPCFISPWNAVERATDLAWELGIPCAVRVDNLMLSPRVGKKKNCHSVRFEGHDDSLKGKVELKEFLPCIQSLEDEYLAPIFHKWPKRPLPEPSPEAGRNQAPRSSAGSASHRHFLDRILPDDLLAYIHHLQTLWRDELLRLPAEQQYRLRTWYIHHLHQPKCRMPRAVTLTHDPESWHQGLLAAWRDQIHDDELLTIAVVFPRVRDQNLDEPTQADVMLIQGQQEGAHTLRGGVTTVYLPGDDRYYIGAASYARHLSGIGILEGVDTAELLQTHACDIFHGSTAIPSTSTPVHWTMHGHSFVAVFHDLTGPRASSSTQGVPSSEIAIQPIGLPSPAPDEGGEEESPQVSTSSFDEEDLQGLQVFRLGQPGQQPGHHCFVRWRSYNMILFDTLHSLGIHRDRAVGFHYVQAPLVDQHEAEEAIILQLVGDIPGGSADKLVLIDLTYYTAGLDAAHQRIVRRLPRFLSRPSLITQLHLQAPCEDSPDLCTFHFNNDLWSDDDLFPRELQHGTYLRVEVTVDPPTRACAPATSTHVEVPAGPSRPDPRGAAGTTDVSSFMQRPPTLKEDSKLLMSHSATFPSLAGRQEPGPGRHHNSRRIAQEQQHSWMPQAKMTFRECAAVEFDDEGPVLYWTTWFLHHQRYTKSFESRTLRLDAAHRFWFEELCNLWADAMDPHRPARVAFVHPTPPAADDSQHVGHLILVQGQGAEHPVLLTALFDHAVQRRIWHLAALQPNYVGQETILEDLGIARWCNLRRCRLQAGDIHLGPMDLVQLQDGESIVITISSMQQVPTETDVFSLMQKHLQTTTKKSSDHLSQLMQAAPQAGFTVQSCGSSQLNPNAPAFDPRQPDLRTLSEFQADLWVQWDQEAFAWEDEERSCTILTWFVDHIWQWPHCDLPRRLQLYEDYHQWETHILDRWQDVRDRSANYEIHVVDPRPPSLDNDIAAHVVIIQRPHVAWITNLATIIEETQAQQQPVGQIAITTHEHVRAENILTATSLERVCLQPPAPLRCQVWLQGFQLPMGILFPGRSGTGIEIHLWPAIPEIPHTEGHSLLQIQSSRRREEERQTGSAVAHACRPSPVKLQLSDLLEDDEATNAQDHSWGVKLQSGHEDIVVPEYIEVSLPAGPTEVEQELHNWGIRCQAIQFTPHDHFLCLPQDHCFEEGTFSYMFCNEDACDEQGCILHTQHKSLSPIEMMSLLDSLGYPRAVVLNTEHLTCGLIRISFCNTMPKQAIAEQLPRARTAWPSRDVEQWEERPLLPSAATTDASGQHRVLTGFDNQDLAELRDASDSFLQTDFTGIELPEFIKDAVCVPRHHQQYDRWLVYTDGSSQTSLRRLAPQQADERGMPDTWAMLVLGEKFTDEETSVIEPIGWCAHPVRYDESGASYTGAQRIGAEVAERDALVWAGLWRLSQDSITPTVYCCDALTSGKQAFGLIGTGDADLSFRLLRGLFQGLDHGLPAGHLRLHHVKSHAGDPYNEFVDLMAKREAHQSFHHRRPPLNMQSGIRSFLTYG